MMGGIGHLSRSLGLSIDSLVSIRGVRGDGEPFVLTEGSRDTSWDLWAMMLGAAPFFGVVTEVTL